jgi:hypothetical protein
MSASSRLPWIGIRRGTPGASSRLASQTPRDCLWSGRDERVLGEQNADVFRRLVHSVGEVRHADGPRDHALWRLHPGRWLESLVVQDLAEVDERLDATSLCSQVPVFSASDRAMIDVLTTTRDVKAGGGGVEGRRRYPPAAARSGLLLVAGRLASCAGRVSTLRILFRAGTVTRSAFVVSGGSGAARASRPRYLAALRLA